MTVRKTLLKELLEEDVSLVLLFVRQEGVVQAEALVLFLLEVGMMREEDIANGEEGLPLHPQVPPHQRNQEDLSLHPRIPLGRRTLIRDARGHIVHGRERISWASSKKVVRMFPFLVYDGTYGNVDKVLGFIQQFDSAFGGERFTESSKLRHVAMYFQKSARSLVG